MEATTNTRKRKPLADRTNTASSSHSSNSITTESIHKLPPPPPSPTISNSTSSAAPEPVSYKISNQIKERNKQNQQQQERLVGTGKRRKLGDTTTITSRSVDNDAYKEIIPSDDGNYVIIAVDSLPDISNSSPSALSVRQQLSSLAEPLTVYARRQTPKKKGKEKVVNEAFTCLPVDRKRNQSNKESVAKYSKCLTELPKKRRNKEHVVSISNDYIEQKIAYFAEIDECELPEEEVSESELSDH